MEKCACYPDPTNPSTDRFYSIVLEAIHVLDKRSGNETMSLFDQ